jgi:class 3 adenylate cyclase
LSGGNREGSPIIGRRDNQGEVVVTTADWLKSLGMSEYAARFSANRIDVSALPALTDGDLQRLGVAASDRERLLLAIAKRRADSIPAQAPAADERLSRRKVERRHLTVLFCDLVGSTEISTRLDPEEFSEIIDAYRHCCASVIVKSGGFLAQYLGDGVLAYFGYPQASEDDAERAVSAGLSLVEAVAV